MVGLTRLLQRGRRLCILCVSPPSLNGYAERLTCVVVIALPTPTPFPTMPSIGWPANAEPVHSSPLATFTTGGVDGSSVTGISQLITRSEGGGGGRHRGSTCVAYRSRQAVQHRLTACVYELSRCRRAASRSQNVMYKRTLIKLCSTFLNYNPICFERCSIFTTT